MPALERAGLEVPARPSGAFYIYAAVPGGNGRRFALELLEKEGVAATPGIDFGANGTGRFVRFAYTRALSDLEEAGRRIEQFCARSPASGDPRPAPGARARRAP